MYLTRKDLAGTIVAALVVLVYAANVEGWWYLGGNRWAEVTMFGVGAIGWRIEPSYEDRIEMHRTQSEPPRG